MAGLLAVPRLGASRTSQAWRRGADGDARARAAGRALSGADVGALPRSGQGGVDPDEVGRLVLDAIRHDRFWIFTAAELVTSVQRQVTAMAEDHALSRLRPG
jgi:hypothetical protein